MELRQEAGPLLSEFDFVLGWVGGRRLTGAGLLLPSFALGRRGSFFSPAVQAALVGVRGRRPALTCDRFRWCCVGREEEQNPCAESSLALRDYNVRAMH